MPYDKWTKLQMTPGKLRELHQEHTQPEIAVMLGVTEMTVRRWLRKHGIEGLHSYERRVMDRTGPTLADLTEETLRHLYEERLLTDEEIGGRYGVTKTPIRHRRREWGIETISKAERSARLGPQTAPTRAAPKPSSRPTAAPSKPPRRTQCAWKDCEKTFESHAGSTYCSDDCRRAVEAERARRKRAKNKSLEPIEREFTCENPACGRKWKTTEPGNWRRCPSCRDAEQREREKELESRRHKVCVYDGCGRSFTDDSSQNSMKFCSEVCRGKAKRLRSGAVLVAGSFLDEQTRQCVRCDEDYTPRKTKQRFCSEACRKADREDRAQERRRKTCVECGGFFVDSSPKNNMRAHPKCSRQKWGHKANMNRPLDDSPNTSSNRRQRVWHGDGGRVDDIKTLKKYTTTWWGRVSELIYGAYRSQALDMNEKHGNRAPYDYQDPEHGRVDARGSKGRLSPQGRLMWTFNVAGLSQSCDHAFLVGYSEDRQRVEHLWLVPREDLEHSSMRMAPGSREYRGDRWDVSAEWGLEVANVKLAELHALPEPERPEDRFAWMDDESNLSDGAPGHRGRKSEILYQRRYPKSEDMNRKNGATHPFDFLDPDGTKVNVKSARRTVKKSGAVHKWSFSRGVRDQELGHRCDLYSCLCLAEDGKTVLREYRIPASTWADKRTIHIYESGGQWERWLVPNISVSQQT